MHNQEGNNFPPDFYFLKSDYENNSVKSEITFDVWWKPKVTLDYSLLRAAFFFGMDPQDWLSIENWVEVYPATKTIVSDWAAKVNSWPTIWDSNLVETRRHPRYQPNRGHLFSTACFQPNPTANWLRRIWFMCPDYKAVFQLENWVLYAVIINKAWYKIKEPINLALAWLTIDSLAYWTLYDIQFQWRGVWDYFFYLNQKLVHKTNFLGNNTEMTLANPTMSWAFYSENTDWTEVSIHAGCIDVTSEWGKTNSVSYISVAQESPLTIATSNVTPLVIVHVKEELWTEHNTRDVQAYRVIANTSKDAFVQAYYTRDPSAIWGSPVFADARPGSWVEYAYNNATIDTAKCQLLWSRFTKTEQDIVVDLPSDNVDFYLTSWDYLIITWSWATQYEAISSIEMGEEV